MEKRTMARNDIILLDSFLEKFKLHHGSSYSNDQYFELFVFHQLLKHADPSLDEIEVGWVDGGDDGGIDGLFLLLDGQIVVETLDWKSIRRNPLIEVIVVTAKLKKSFSQSQINSIIPSLRDFFDLTRDDRDISPTYKIEIIDIRKLFRDMFIGLAPKNPKLLLRMIYACRGDTKKISPNVSARSNYLKSDLADLFSDTTIEFEFAGAAELVDLERHSLAYNLSLPFVENYVSRSINNYVVLVALKDYFKFITDDNLQLRRYLFEGNVRDYLGKVQVNRDIMDTLEESPGDRQVDFWWLNNGVTFLASNATVVGKQLSLENVQIVNGLQTTETVARYFSEADTDEDDRALLVKIVVTQDEDTRSRIVKATNYQNSVELASLRAMDKIQRDIEQFLSDAGWFYDRRKNYYRNLGKPADRIVSMSFLGAAIRALVFRELGAIEKQQTKWMRDDERYNMVFDEDRDLRVYLVCIEVVKRIDLLLRDIGAREGHKRLAYRARMFVISLLYVLSCLKTTGYAPEDLIQLQSKPAKRTEIEKLIDHIDECGSEWGFDMTRGKLGKRQSRSFTQYVVDRFVGNSFRPIRRSQDDEKGMS